MIDGGNPFDVLFASRMFTTGVCVSPKQDVQSLPVFARVCQQAGRGTRMDRVQGRLVGWNEDRPPPDRLVGVAIGVLNWRKCHDCLVVLEIVSVTVDDGLIVHRLAFLTDTVEVRLVYIQLESVVNTLTGRWTGRISIGP